MKALLDAIKKHLNLRYALWGLVAFLLIVDVGMLVVRSSFPSVAEVSPNQPLSDEQTAIKGLSFWQDIVNKWENASGSDHRSAFDNADLDAEYDESVVSIMIDNFSYARPQHTGLRAASVVFEALVEGGITRLMLSFPYQELDRVGPVRSARDYFVAFAEPFGGTYVHAGGSPQAYEALEKSRVVSLEEAEEPEQEGTEQYSFRDLAYAIPHNLFFDLLLTREKSPQTQAPLNPQWCFREADQLPEGVTAEHIEINYANDRTSSSLVRFVYDEETLTYKRFYGLTSTLPHIDQAESLQVAPDNVVVMVMPSYLIDGDEKERLQMDTTGEGAAFFYRNGQRYEGAWSRDTAEDHFRFEHTSGERFCFQPGQTWIAVVDDDSLVTDRSSSE